MRGRSAARGIGRRAALVVLPAVLALAGCGGDGTEEAPSGGVAARGSLVFAEAGCGGCHTLAEAKATGTAGPSLDEVKVDARIAAEQVERGGGGMPAFADKLSEREVADLAAFVARASGSKAASTKQFVPDRRTVADCGTQDITCFRQAFGNLAFREGPKPALRRFAAAIERLPVVAANCHPMAHTIGAAALRRFRGDMGPAFAAGDATCNSGYFHGLVEWKLADVPDDRIGAAAREVCTGDDVRRSVFLAYQCVHGLGHGLMLHERNDLPKALELCHELGSRFDRVSCSGGVFMENQQPTFGQRSEWLKDDDLLFPCTSDLVKGEDKLYCYLQVTSQVLPRVGRDYGRAARWCRRADRDFVRICFQSLGRDGAAEARYGASRTIELCATARPDGEGECLFGAVREVLNQRTDDPRAKELCEAVPAEHRAYCAYGAGSLIGTVQRTRPAREAACRRLAPAAVRADCVKGAETVPATTG